MDEPKYLLVDAQSLSVGDTVLLDLEGRVITRIVTNRIRTTVFYVGRNKRTGQPKERGFTFWHAEGQKAWKSGGQS